MALYDSGISCWLVDDACRAPVAGSADDAACGSVLSCRSCRHQRCSGSTEGHGAVKASFPQSSDTGLSIALCTAVHTTSTGLPSAFC
ncbi:hypothetical protein O3P69_020531 [Scylla paramamosain]|uniref:Uncharacterized protein n=1 Tax=Scylla paramamosain TaxID=85552 RepID=A0AAW0TLH2_SCYPA